MAPAEPTQTTDQDSSWCKGTEWSLDSRASTDWWNSRTERRTRTPVDRVQTKWDYRLVAFIPFLAVNRDMKGVSAPDRMKQKEAGLRKNGSPLLRDMAIQMEPIAIMVRLRRATTAEARFRSMRGEDGKKQCRRKCENNKHEINSEKSWHTHSGSRDYTDSQSYIFQGFDLI